MTAISYAHGASSWELLGDTIGENLRRIVELYPDREALVSPYQAYRATYRQFWDQTTVAARAMMAHGVRKGDRVGVWAPNCYEWAVLQYATARIGAIHVCINPAYDDDEGEYALKLSGANLLFTVSSFRDQKYPQMVEKMRPRLTELREVVILDGGWEPFLVSAAATSEAAVAEREAPLQCDDPAHIQFTSGTTGRPKGATLSHHNILNNAYMIARTMKYTENDRACVPVQFYHTMGNTFGNLACTTHGACVVIPAPAYDPVSVMWNIQSERCTSLIAVPSMFIGMLDHPRFREFSFASMRTGIMAGAPCPLEVMKKVLSQMHMSDVTICYGMTETSPVSCQTTIDDVIEKRVTTVGRAHPHVEIKIVDPKTDEIVPRGKPGEFCARGYHVMLGYWRNEEATRKAIAAGRWMHTGDVAVMDQDGYVKVMGRIKDTIYKSGEAIYPREIEEVLYAHYTVSDVQVIGVPDETHGEEIMAWVKFKPGLSATEEQLTEFCGMKVSASSVPRHWKFVDAFPTNMAGKIMKFMMREMVSAELARAAAKTA